jgi:hypothetical protein
MYAIGNGRSGTSIRSPIKSWEGRRCPTIGNGDNGKMRWRSSFLNDPFAPFATFRLTNSSYECSRALCGD